MNEANARAVEAAIGDRVHAWARDWAGGMWGVETDTPFVTPDGRTSIQLWVGSDDEGAVVAQYGDVLYGQYSDDLVWLPLTDSDHAGVADWVVGEIARLNDGGYLPDEYGDGLRKAYADTIDG